MTKPFFLDELQIYITNVCNLTCENCITYNNFRFTGHYYFEDHAEYYQEWSKKLRLDCLSFIGGEPFTHPTLLEWVDKMKNLWPDCEEYYISTNGTFLKNRIDDCKELLRKRVWLSISVHDPALYEEIESALLEILSVFSNVKRTKSSAIADSFYANGRKLATLERKYVFTAMSLKEIKNQTIYMHHSDPTLSHGDCGTCHTFIRGCIYKCFHTAIAPDLCQQFTVDSQAREILLSYKPCSPYDTDDEIAAFINKITEPIEQCRTCPESRPVKPIWPLAKTKTKI